MNQVRSEQVNRSGSGQVGYWQIKKMHPFSESLFNQLFFLCEWLSPFCLGIMEDILREEADP